MKFLRIITWLIVCLLGPTLALAAPVYSGKVKPVVRLVDSQALDKHFRSMGYKKRGGVSKDRSDRDEREARSFPHFSSSFSVGGVTYPYTMVGYTPRSGRETHIRSVIIPLRMNFNFFGTNQDVFQTFDPAAAVANIVGSPLYKPATYANGHGQFVDQMQRATFWNKMDPGRNWHVTMETPKVLPTIDVYVTPETGTLFALGGTVFGDVLFDFMDAQAQTILQLLDLPADVLPIFVTGQSTAEALGYHNAFELPLNNGGTRLQTYIYTSWLDPATISSLLADVSTFNHELSEWANDPFVNNIVPTWAYPPASDPRSVCAGNPFLETGDPQGNGPTYDDFPTVPVTLAGVTYHLQQLVMLPWFADEVPSSAFAGAYSFPVLNSVTQPAVYCK
jgi:hypothetical protein